MGALLVTGCSGLLGANLCFACKESKRVIGVGRSPFHMSGVEHIPTSFENIDIVMHAVEEFDVDCVIHCAAVTNVDACEGNPELAMRVNCDSSVRLADAVSARGIRFVFISSDAVFSGKKDGAYSEEDATCPINVYGETKARAEEGIVSFPNALVVRTNLYGINYQDKSSFGEWIAGSLKNGETLTMFQDVSFSPLVADTLANAIVAAIDVGAEGVLNLSATGSITKYAFGVELKERMGLGGKVVAASVDDFDFAARRSHNMALDNARACALLGKVLPTPVEGIVHFIELYEGEFGNRLREGVS